MIRDFTIEEYVVERDRRPGVFYESEWYTKHIPLLTIAQCPYCKVDFSVRIDVNSLAYWNSSRKIGASGIRFVASRNFNLHKCDHLLYKCCEHLFLLDSFLNFRGKDYHIHLNEKRHPLTNKEFYSEVPGLMADYMNAKIGVFTKEDVETTELSRGQYSLTERLVVPYYQKKKLQEEKVPIKAVLSHQPICQIKNRQFNESLDAYFVSYFVPESNDALLQGAQFRWNNPDAIYHTLDVISYFHDSNLYGTLPQNIDFDLLKYVQRGDLLWLQEGNLHGKEDIDLFPYSNIKGRKEPFTAKFLDTEGF